MKIRNGFVSNSSSSSFIVTFPHDPADADDVRKMMFQDNDTPVQPYDYMVPTREIAEIVWRDIERQRKYGSFKCAEAQAQFANYCVDDYDDQDSATHLLGEDKVQALLSKMCVDYLKSETQTVQNSACTEKTYSGYYNLNDAIVGVLGKAPDYTAPLTLIRDYAQKELNLKIMYAELVQAELKKFAEGGVVYKFHYSDEDGELYCAMEHGDIFKKLKHVRISHH